MFFLCISRYIGKLEFPPRMVLRRFSRILSYFNTFLSNVNIFVVVVEIKLNNKLVANRDMYKNDVIP